MDLGLAEFLWYSYYQGFQDNGGESTSYENYFGVDADNGWIWQNCETEIQRLTIIELLSKEKQKVL